MPSRSSSIILLLAMFSRRSTLFGLWPKMISNGVLPVVTETLVFNRSEKNIGYISIEFNMLLLSICFSELQINSSYRKKIAGQHEYPHLPPLPITLNFHKTIKLTRLLHLTSHCPSQLDLAFCYQTYLKIQA